MLYKQKSRNRRLGTSRRPGWCEKGSPGSKARRKETCLKFLWTSAGFFKGPRSRGSTHPPCRSASGHLSLRRRLPVSPSGTLVGDWGPGHDDAPVVMTVGDVRPVARARQIVLGWGQSSKKISPPPPPTMMMMNRRDTDPRGSGKRENASPSGHCFSLWTQGQPRKLTPHNARRPATGADLVHLPPTPTPDPDPDQPRKAHSEPAGTAMIGSFDAGPEKCAGLATAAGSWEKYG